MEKQCRPYVLNTNQTFLTLKPISVQIFLSEKLLSLQIETSNFPSELRMFAIQHWDLRNILILFPAWLIFFQTGSRRSLWLIKKRKPFLKAIWNVYICWPLFPEEKKRPTQLIHSTWARNWIACYLVHLLPL